MEISRRSFFRSAIGATVAMRLANPSILMETFYPPATKRTLRAWPFWVTRTTKIDRVAFEIVYGRKGGIGTAGIYRPHSESNPSPDKLVISTGSRELVAGIHQSTVFVTLTPGVYYWAFLGNLTFPEKAPSNCVKSICEITSDVRLEYLPSGFPGRSKLRMISEHDKPRLGFRAHTNEYWIGA